MASNSTSGPEEAYECTLNNQCLTIISVGGFFGLMFCCMCTTVIIRLINFYSIDLPLRSLPAPEPQDPKPLNSENPIRVVTMEEDPC